MRIPPHHIGLSRKKPPLDCSGLTLIELLVVLLILAAVAGTATSIFSNGARIRGADGQEREAAEIVTLATLREVAEACLGTSTSDRGYRGDLGNLPPRLAGLFLNLNSDPPYDPVRKQGWRGPYITGGGARYGDLINTGDNFPTTPTTLLDDPSIPDGWGKPLLLQQPDTEDARLVSAGANGILETNPLTPIDPDRGDDLIFFLLSDDPNL